MKGWSELALCAAVLAAAWTRTPAGALVEGAVALARGREPPDLLAAFRTALPSPVEAALSQPIPDAGSPAPAGPWSPALDAAITSVLGPDAPVAIAALRITDPEAALETWAVGAEPRRRAIARARAAREAEPDRYETHRRYLPDATAREADRAVRDTLALATVLDLSWPVAGGAAITSGFGWRTHPVLGTRKFHEGVDIAVPVGTAVAAAHAGRVARASEDAVSGIHVVLDHGHGVTTSYCHASALRVAGGDRVESGAVVMDSGNTGRSTGPHLHFGLRVLGRPVDPTPLRPAARRET